ncbi:MAG: bifunctional 4-hydroxy-2-oxoglutarate aldolase/2-dehydro-3-deoxy-phosphogluconate aldolase [Spirochaeta sp.]|jgi:2-dehydro-3-deoxyphosphogluconate aldolase/(4S)-4-hydroxy-2-oxoglutarate aldolase|nr:bifunctional 4-hydroxy-2-oxoglutarate aldolase/2-dehydro-3-deoxy-phosphogluconate aldolase [Spirochaeta sp.]
MEQTVYAKIASYGLVPVIKLTDPDHAVPLAEALSAGRLPVAEVTFRTDSAAESIRRIGREAPDVIVGAGTVLTVEQAKQAVEVGAQYIVTPGFNPTVVRYCVDNGVPITPGVNNPTAVEQALEFGLTLLKFFPAEASGGLAMLKALAGPYGHVSFVPTGGVNGDNLAAYIAQKNVAAVGGSWIVPGDAITTGDFKRITTLTAEAIEIVKTTRAAATA